MLRSVLLPLLATQTYAASIAGGNVKVDLGENGLEFLVFGSVALEASDSWQVDTKRGTVTQEDCTFKGYDIETATMCALRYECPDEIVWATYEVVSGAYLTKGLSLESTHFYENMTINGASTFRNLKIENTSGIEVQGNIFHGDGLQIAGFSRFSTPALKQKSLFFSVMNPFGRHMFNSSGLQIMYSGQTNHTGRADLDRVVMGIADLGKYKHPANQNLYASEVFAFRKSVTSFLYDGARKEPLILNTGWDENDYQIDLATEAGIAEYQRILSRCAQMGISHLIAGPQNSAHSSRFNTTDGWGWETVLWFSMGEKIREGKWNPSSDPMPSDVLSFSKNASTSGVKILAYVYPIICFEPLKEYFVGSGGNCVDLSKDYPKDWVLNALVEFYQKAGPGMGGFAWDHGALAGNDKNLQYAQWRNWLWIRQELTVKFPGIQMDNRQLAHIWGPWHLLPPSYAEPLAGDENPETYGVPFPSLHTDIVTANVNRRVNLGYMNEMLIPSDRMCGFTGHQTERTSDSGVPACFGGEKQCYDMNIRDFDILGYRYSLISTIATGAMNIVWAMIPARDIAEFKFFPQEDLDFVNKWHGFAKANINTLRNTQSIPQISAVQIGSIDGYHAMLNDEGFVFLFNPSMEDGKVTLPLDECLGIAATTGSWNFNEIYPLQRTIGTYKAGANITFTVTGREALVIRVSKTTSNHRHTVIGAPHCDGTISGPKGQTLKVEVAASSSALSGKNCTTGRESTYDGMTTYDITFGGDRLATSMPAVIRSKTSAWINMTATITSGMKQQLDIRSDTYPIPWSPDTNDYNASWLVPTRLPFYVFYSNPQWNTQMTAYVNGAKTELVKARSSRGTPLPERTLQQTFMGWYIDFTTIMGEAKSLPMKLDIDINTNDTKGFIGGFWENIVLETTTEISSC
eukprot:TRINITY_DN431_c14_g1_i1.p1 TRINITY_DN431_c14_g1~~TRINITY_DN431_c14_g1_i1.p1  ORF type:complete len:958 (+),score=168.93 TRINITY_DN431_c14_g1_i1:132-2876(+)